VKTHLEQLFDKLDGSTRTEAVTAAARMGLLLI
jgi:ATP/maltotriose-dependent transcriptional regulator MalT